MRHKGVAPEHARRSAFQRLLLRLRFLVVQTSIPLGHVPGELGRCIDLLIRLSKKILPIIANICRSS